MVDADDIDGAIVRKITVAGGTLTAVVQLADGTTAMLPFSPSAAAGGLSDYTALGATYVAATQTMSFVIFGSPNLDQGVGIYVATPASLDDSENNLVIEYDGDNYEVYDTTVARVRPADLSANQIYEFRRFTIGSNPSLVIMRPLSLDQIVPIQTATVPVTNAQLKTLDDTYIEVIPAPGAGRFIEIVRIRFNVSGSDEIPTSFPGTTTDDQAVRNMLNSIRYSLLYVLDDSNGYPLFAYGGEFTTAYSERYTNLINQNGSLIFSVGDQQLQENKALVFGFYLLLSDVFRTLMGQGAPYYSAASYDYFLG